MRLLPLLCGAMLLHLTSRDALAQQTELEPVARRRPAERSVLLGIGRTTQLDTYLSPMDYSGLQVSFLTASERMTRMADGRISFQSMLHGAFTSTQNPAGTAHNLGGRLAYDAGWHFHFSPLPRLDLKGGALIGTDVGFLYNDRNGNNPAQGRFSADLSLSAGAAYSIPLRRLPLRFRYQADLPMLGVMFSPEFGESYYEISQHGVRHDIICAHPGNALCLRQLLSADLCLPRITLRLAYLHDVRQSNARSLKYRDASHSFMIGVVRYFSELRTKKRTNTH